MPLDDDDKKRMALNMAAHFRMNPGSTIRDNNIVTYGVREGISYRDLYEGVELGIELDWFNRSETGSIILTEARQAEI